jgi:hypothetical protein
VNRVRSRNFLLALPFLAEQHSVSTYQVFQRRFITKNSFNRWPGLFKAKAAVQKVFDLIEKIAAESSRNIISSALTLKRGG